MPGFIDWLDTGAGRVPRIGSELTFADRWDSCKARLGFGRMDYMVPPGLYAVGAPSAESPVVVTANYKMTYDALRRSVAGCDVWVLVLETYGINVWCAAGKGTFGTDELVKRVTVSGLSKVVSHRRLLLPILGAPGVAAHKVKSRCGFAVSYAAVYAEDLPKYLENGSTTPAMREVRFSLYDRFVLIPIEVLLQLKPLATAAAVVFLACALGAGLKAGVLAFGAYVGAVLCGVAGAPLLLPWLPSRSFAVKGAVLGLVWTVLYRAWTGGEWAPLPTAAAVLILPAVSAFYALNFTGCTTYTSRSGVKKEMRLGIPSMGVSVVLGIVLLAISRFV